MNFKRAFTGLFIFCLLTNSALAEKSAIRVLNCEWQDSIKDDKGSNLGTKNYDKQFLVDAKNKTLYNRDLEEIAASIFNEKNIAFNIRTRAYDSNILRNYTIDRGTGNLVVKSEQEFVNGKAKQYSDGVGICNFINDR